MTVQHRRPDVSRLEPEHEISRSEVRVAQSPCSVVRQVDAQSPSGLDCIDERRDRPDVERAH